MMGRHFTVPHRHVPIRHSLGACSGGLLRELVRGVPGLAQLRTEHDLRYTVDQAQQPEQQRTLDTAVLRWRGRLA
jgi:hypothetical protein